MSEPVDDRRVSHELMLAYVEINKLLKRHYIIGHAEGNVVYCRECSAEGRGKGPLTATSEVVHEPWCLTPLAFAAEQAELGVL